MRKICKLVLGLLLVCLLTGCERENEKSNISIIDEMIVTSDEGYSELYNETNDNLQQSYGSFGFGLRMEEDEIQTDANHIVTFIYSGGTVKIPYYIENVDPQVTAEFGILAFTDGIAQPFQIEDSNGNVLNKTEYMQQFSLAVGERKEFYLSFTPVAGKKGDTIGFITATILKPDYVPEHSEHGGRYGVYYSLSATIPNQITILQDVESDKISAKDYTIKDIPEDILGQIEDSLAGETLEEHLNNTVELNITPVDETDYAVIENEKVKLKFTCYGGPEVLDRVNFYINNQLVKVNNANYLEVRTETGKMIEAEVELSVENLQLDNYNTIYAVLMTGGEDYKVCDIFGTDPLLLVKKG